MIKVDQWKNRGTPSMSHNGTVFKGLVGITAAMILAIQLSNPQPVQAEPTLKRILQNTPQSRLKFSPFTVGSIIAGATDRVYVLTANKGQFLRIQVQNTGARAYVVVFNPNGKELKLLTDQSDPFTYELSQTGDYYIFCHGGPTYHFYDLSIRID